jgi:hypothetical protein
MSTAHAQLHGAAVGVAAAMVNDPAVRADLAQIGRIVMPFPPPMIECCSCPLGAFPRKRCHQASVSQSESFMNTPRCSEESLSIVGGAPGATYRS